jgi:hypothetical protein
MLWKRTTMMLAAFGILTLLAIVAAAMPEPGKGPTLKLPAVDKAEVTKIDISGPKGKFTVAEQQGKWLIQPGDYAVNDTVLGRGLDEITGLKFGAMVAEKSASHAKYEVGDDTAVFVTPYTAKGAAWTLLVGKPSGDQRGCYARVKGDDRVYVALARLRDTFDRDAKYWRDKTVAKFDADKAVTLTLKSAAETINVKKADDGTWSFDPAPAALPADYRLDSDKIKRVLQSLSSLNAADFDDSTAPLDRGLEPPQFTVTVALLDGTKLGLNLGAAKEKNVYAQKQGDRQVLLIGDFYANNLRKTLDDLRDLHVAAFDADKATKLAIVEGARKLTLEKTGEDKWRIAESTETVPTDYVIDTTKVMFVVRAAASLQGTTLLGKTAPAEAKLGAPVATVTATLGDGTEKRIIVGADQDKEKQYVAGGDGRVYLAPKGVVSRVVKKLDAFKVTPPHQDKIIDPALLNQLPPAARDHFIEQQRQTIMQNQMLQQLMKKEGKKKPGEK